MQIGTYFPSPDLGTDPVFIRDYAQAMEGVGYDYLEVFEHVTGAHPSRFENPGFAFRPKNSGVTYTYETAWHEPLTLWAHLAAVTTTIEFVPSVLLLSQRQTVLAAKQIAEIDILSGGRFRLAVGIGWNFTEYEALGMDWATRTARIEEQMEVLRLLWSQPLVSFEGRFHHLDQVGINPLPPRGPLKIMYAGSARDVVLDRAVRCGDGWMPLLIPPETPRDSVEKLHAVLARYGKDPATFDIDASVRRMAPGVTPLPGSASALNPTPWQDQLKLWHELGASHVCMSCRAPTAAEAMAFSIETKHIIDNEMDLS